MLQSRLAGPRLGRRAFLAATTALTASAVLPLNARAQMQPWAAPRNGRFLSTSHFGAFEAVVENGRLIETRAFEKDPVPSPMVGNFPGILYDRSRVLRPAIRQSWLEQGPGANTDARGAEPFIEVPWDEALDMVAAELTRVKETYGNESIYGASYGWSSACRFHAADGMTNKLLASFGGYVNDLTNYSYGAGMVLLPHIVGDNQAIAGPITTWATIVEHTQTMLMFGGACFKNGRITWGGSGEHTSELWMRRAHSAGVEMIAINPVAEAEIVDLDLEWIAPRPNTDTAIMLGMAHVLLTADRADRDFLDRYTVGFDRVAAYLTGAEDGIPKTAAWAEAISGVPAATIEQLAHKLVDTRSLIVTAWSLQRAEFGEQTWWATILLAAMVGQIGLPGGGFSFSHTSINGYAFAPSPLSVPGFGAGRNPVRLSIPVARIADMLLNPGGTLEFNGQTLTYPDIRLIYWAGGNPFHHHQDLNRLTCAWAKPETVIVHEPWWTPTARRADIVLPATTTLERNDIGASPRDRFLFAMPKLVEPVGEARDDFEIFRGIAARLGIEEAFTDGKDAWQWVTGLYEEARERTAMEGVTLPPFEEFWEAGFIEVPGGDPHYTSLSEFRADPEGFSLYTPSGKIELFSETIAGFGYDDCPGHPTWLEPQEYLGSPRSADYPFHLLSTHPSYRLHSQMDNAPLARNAKVAGREPVWMNPQDAAAHGLADGSVVELHNDRGRMLAGLVVTDRVRPGVLVMYEGAWVDPVMPGTVGSLDKHGNPNMVTRDVGTSRLGQGCAAQSALVAIRAADETPDVTAWDPPALRSA